MANSSPDDPELTDSQDADLDGAVDRDADTNRIERWIVAGAVVGPILLGLVTWVDHTISSNPFVFSSVWTTILGYAEQIVLLGLTIWLALLHPILGGKWVRSTFVALLIVTAHVAVQFSHSFTNLPNPDIAKFIIIHDYASFLFRVTALVLARRLLHMVLVKRSEPISYVPRRLSILELMLWAMLIAGILAFYTHMQRWADNSGFLEVSVPGWFMIYSFVATYAPEALLVATIIYCWRLPVQKWLPIVFVVYSLGSAADQLLQRAVFRWVFLYPNSQFNLSAELANGIQDLVNPAIVVVMALLVIWIFKKLGYRFQIGPQVGESGEFVSQT